MGSWAPLAVTQITKFSGKCIKIVIVPTKMLEVDPHLDHSYKSKQVIQVLSLFEKKVFIKRKDFFFRLS